jgi:hypothetical protein
MMGLSVRHGARPFRTAGAVLASLLVLGILLGCLHHHDRAQDSDNCALCSLVHVAVIAAPRVDPPATRLLESGTVVALPVAPSASEDRYTAPPRAPPLS